MRLYVPLTQPEIDALIELARAERRRPQEQAAKLIGEALREQLLHQEQTTPCSTTTVADGKGVADEA